MNKPHQTNEPDLNSFVDTMLEAVWEGGDYTGYDIQEIALYHNILKKVQVTESCGEFCGCVEHITEGEVFTCFRKNY